MAARIGRVYSRYTEGQGSSGGPAGHFFGDRRLLFVDRRARLRERLGKAILALAWAAAIAGVALILGDVV